MELAVILGFSSQLYQGSYPVFWNFIACTQFHNGTQAACEANLFVRLGKRDRTALEDSMTMLLLSLGLKPPAYDLQL